MDNRKAFSALPLAADSVDRLNGKMVSSRTNDAYRGVNSVNTRKWRPLESLLFIFLGITSHHYPSSCFFSKIILGKLEKFRSPDYLFEERRINYPNSVIKR